MKNKLSKREIVMIDIAVVFIIVFIGLRFVLFPYYNVYTAKLDEYDLLLYERDSAVAKLNNESAILANNKAARDEVEEIIKRYPMAISSYEADLILTGLCQMNDMNPISLGLSAAKPYAPPSDNSNESAKAGEASPKPPAFSVMSANMSLSGSYESLKSLMDTVETMDFLRITKASFSTSLEAGKTGSPNTSVTFDITMLNEVKPPKSNAAED